MSHSLSKIWIHAIWSTKEWVPHIHSKIEKQVYLLISEQLKEQGCMVRNINGMPDHVHCLFLLNPQKSISEIIKNTKGSSSHKINQSDLISAKFAWQKGYGAFSISESAVEKVSQYISNQKAHHLKKNFPAGMR